MVNLKGRDLLSIADLNQQEIRTILDLAADLKSGKKQFQTNKTLGLLFYKASTRTRVSFSVAMYQLGGNVIDLNPSRTQVGRGEPLQDTARVLDRYLDILAIRTFAQEDIQTFADYSDIPIINALTDLEHPCQILADLQTIEESFGSLEGITMTYLGDGNNVAHSLLLGGVLMGMNVRIATPEGYEPNKDIIKQAQALAKKSEQVVITHNAKEAVENTQVLYTDVWASMGQEEESATREPIFQPYQINEELLGIADKSAIVLHCLPAYRGKEITEEVMEGNQSRIWDEAENRMHAQKALMACLLGLSD
ncbi:ornithine carbamoyltransferase [Cyanobacterium aponinum AL20118]|uniref:Ornithine carbamoyltransferase n=3 Tax=Cyanobacterium aponinum TaxID=379064 RepID=K9Z4F4_CYAAP|nr:ornithine carbamoyltransferase [Cyanobacterium aponinum]AFZ53253.1 ornithine carbamoyltransferase [Cyanobacterium aponinum PCC 10605]MBD2394848.1 ornithine carbamoyltransferase [Cyanobacterium aponinum FACHB-4101]MTF38925.1 ornithine carbamoyltransferase [Cyanobacterium aponinum 0216]WPF90026.1 ornithine carbamoyltransferase [Cyanobacterium aponinum AL20115]